MSFKKLSSVKNKIIGAVLFAPVYLMAVGEQFTTLRTAGDDAKGTVQGLIHTLLWIPALLPFGVGFYAAFKMKEYLENKEEGSQHEPKWMKFGKIIAAFGGGLLIVFLLLGIFGRVFLDLSFGDTWGELVVKFWKEILTK